MDLSYILNHLGEEDRSAHRGAVSPPIYQTSIFAFDTVAAMRDGFADELDRTVYTRGNNPTVEILRKKLAALEGAEDALLFGSGAAAVAAAVLGGALSKPIRAQRAVPALAAGLAGLVLAGTLLALLPRHVGDVNATIRLTPVGDQAIVAVDLQPADAARHATAFGVVSWQGGGRVSAKLNEVGPGRYVSDRPLPITGDWKTMVGLQRSDEVMAAPVYFRADPEIDAPAIPALPQRQAAFVRNTTLLLREQHPGPAWPGVLGYGGLATAALVWTALFAYVAHRISGAGAEPLLPQPVRPAQAPASAHRDALAQQQDSLAPPRGRPSP